jgi:hypothetical protein
VLARCDSVNEDSVRVVVIRINSVALMSEECVGSKEKRKIIDLFLEESGRAHLLIIMAFYPVCATYVEVCHVCTGG